MTENKDFVFWTVVPHRARREFPRKWNGWSPPLFKVDKQKTPRYTGRWTWNCR